MKGSIARSLWLLAALLIWDVRPVAAVDELCDPSYQNCRARLLTLINNEKVGIDAAWWFMEDSRFASALIARWRDGVPVRIIIDTDANGGYPLNKDMLALVKNAGIPMREKTTGGILHWKMMLFAGQGQVEFSGANYSGTAFSAIDPYVNYVDELIYFTDDDTIVNSFRTKFDDLWISTSGYANYANITTPLVRKYDVYPISPEMNFPPGADFASRSVRSYNAETQQIDAIMYRITDRRHTDALINALNRNVRVRLITEPVQYRDQTRLWHAWNVDRLYLAMLDATARGLKGGEIKHREHLGLSHEKMTVLYGQTLSIFGSSNWTGPSANSQQEHNIFTTRPWMFTYGVEHFNRKWNSVCDSPTVCDPAVYPWSGSGETSAFIPLGPQKPVYVFPGNGALGQPKTLTLKWYAGPWAHKYDIYLSTDPNSTVPLVADFELGPSETTTDYVTYTLTTPLEEGKQYYWRVVSRTMANKEAAGPTWSFVTAGGVAPSVGAGDVNLYASKATVSGKWSRVADSTAAGGFRLSNPNAGAAKVAAPLETPADYFEMNFAAVAGTPYHLWVRGKATSNHYNNDSVYVQFSNSVTPANAPTWRIGSTSGATVTMEDCSGCGLADWGWNDNAYGSVATSIYFAETGTVTIRVQVREDGLSIDQIMLSASKFLSASPGAPKFDINIYPETAGTTTPPPPPAPEPPPAPAPEPPPPPAPEPPPTETNRTVVVYPAAAPTVQGAWTTVADSTAANGRALVLPNTGRIKGAAAVASPADYAEFSVTVEAGKPYHLWLRSKATGNSSSNDSVFVQFSGAVDANNNPIYQIGTTSAAEMNLEDCSGCGLNSWGWQDNAWGVGVPAPPIYFASPGTQTIRIQNREDGLLIDQLMLSPDAYLQSAPGALKSDTKIYPQKTAP